MDEHELELAELVPLVIKVMSKKTITKDEQLSLCKFAVKSGNKSLVMQLAELGNDEALAELAALDGFFSLSHWSTVVLAVCNRGEDAQHLQAQSPASLPSSSEQRDNDADEVTNDERFRDADENKPEPEHHPSADDPNGAVREENEPANDEHEPSAGTDTDDEPEHVSEEQTDEEDYVEESLTPIGIKKIEVIFKERYTTTKNGEVMAKSKARGWEDWANSAKQGYECLERLGKLHPKSLELWNLSDTIKFVWEQVRGETQLSLCASRLTNLAILLDRLYVDEIDTYFGSVDVFKRLRRELKTSQRDMREIQEDRADLQELSPREKSIVNDLIWKTTTEAVETFQMRHPPPAKIITETHFDLVINLLIQRIFVVGGHAPVRRDPTDTKYKNYDEEKDNYYHNGVITINEYKTSKKYGAYKQGCDEATKNLFKLLIDYRKKKDPSSDYIFGNRATQSSFKTGIIQRAMEVATGAPMSVDILRKLCVGDYAARGLLQFTGPSKELARQMGHDPETARKYYLKRQTHQSGSDEHSASPSSSTAGANRDTKGKGRAEEIETDTVQTTSESDSEDEHPASSSSSTAAASKGKGRAEEEADTGTVTTGESDSEDEHPASSSSSVAAANKKRKGKGRADEEADTGTAVQTTSESPKKRARKTPDEAVKEKITELLRGKKFIRKNSDGKKYVSWSDMAKASPVLKGMDSKEIQNIGQTIVTKLMKAGVSVM